MDTKSTTATRDVADRVRKGTHPRTHPRTLCVYSNSGCCGPRSKGRGLVSCSSTPPSSACRNAPISSASTCPYPHFTTPHTPHAHFTRHLYHTFSAPISSANTYPYPPSTTPHTLYDTHLPHILVLEFPLQVTPMLQSPLY